MGNIDLHFDTGCEIKMDTAGSVMSTLLYKTVVCGRRAVGMDRSISSVTVCGQSEVYRGPVAAGHGEGAA